MLKQLPLLLTLLLIHPYLLATFDAQLDRDTIEEGETVQLQLQSSKPSQGGPDTTPLLQDFEIVSTSRSSQVNIINGQMSATTQWNLTLAPKQLGTLKIPALTFNGEQSEPLTLNVTQAEATSAVEGAPLFIETHIDQATPYVQQMVHYRVQLYYRAKLVDGSLSTPALDNALIHQLGKDREYSVKRNGLGYRVVERNYALFPQQSGTLTIPAPRLDARIIQSSSAGRGSHPLEELFNSPRMETTRSVRIRGEAQVLQVLPKPDTHQGQQWLPAAQVVLNDTWQPEVSEVQIGVPLSRTLTLRGEAVSGAMLPDLTPQAVSGFNLYPEPSTQQSEASAQSIVGTKVRKIAYIPTQAGTFTLPAIHLSWWNSRENRAEVAQIAARTITVLPAEQGEQPASSPQPPQPAVLTPSQVGEVETTPRTTTTAASTTAASSTPLLHYQPTGWLWATLLFALLWLLTLLLWWKNRATEEQSERSPDNTDISCKSSRKAFIAACNSNNPQQARTTLLQWAACHWPNAAPKGLDALAQRINEPQLTTLLAELDRSLYQQEDSVWNGSTLAQQLKQLPKHVRAEASKDPLRPLYP